MEGEMWGQEAPRGLGLLAEGVSETLQPTRWQV